MGRIRTVKPELFKHEDLFDLERDTGLPIRVAFTGLFTCCDKEGRFKWRPRTLKLDVLPHDELDFSRVLDALATRGFVIKYACNGEEFGFIPTFKKHQIINNRESESDLPVPDKSLYVSTTSTREPRVDDASTTRTEGKGKEGKGKEGEGKELHVEQKPLDLPVEPLTLVENEGDPIVVIFAYWQKVMTSPKAVLDDKRKSAIRKALKCYSPADICKAIRGCSKSPFHMGDNDRKTKYNGLHLILRSAEYTDRFIELDGGAAEAANETMEQRNARITAQFLGEPIDDYNTIEMET
jgi:hypothetical protein